MHGPTVSGQVLRIVAITIVLATCFGGQTSDCPVSTLFPVWPRVNYWSRNHHPIIVLPRAGIVTYDCHCGWRMHDGSAQLH